MCAYFCMGAYKQGRYKTWTLNSGLDYGVDYGLDYGLNFGLDFGLNSIMYELTFCFGTSRPFHCPVFDAFQSCAKG